MTEKSSYEAQLAAMRTVMEALNPLDEASRSSVLSWVVAQFGIKEATALPKPPDFGNQTKTQNRQGTVSFVAQKLVAKSARDLLLAASAHLMLFQSKDSFTRDELVACAREARGWKASYSSQMAINISRMLEAGALFEKARDVFSLSDEALADVEARLAQ